MGILEYNGKPCRWTSSKSLVKKEPTALIKNSRTTQLDCNKYQVAFIIYAIAISHLALHFSWTVFIATSAGIIIYSSGLNSLEFMYRIAVICFLLRDYLENGRK